MKRALALAALPLLALTGCSGGGDAKTQPESSEQIADAAFLEVFNKLDAAECYDDAGKIKIGKAICGDLKAGGDFPELVKLVTGGGIDAKEAGAIIGASTAAYCPEYNNIADAYSK